MQAANDSEADELVFSRGSTTATYTIDFLAIS